MENKETTTPVKSEVIIKTIQTPNGPKKVKVIRKIVAKQPTNISTTNNSLPQPQVVIGPDGVKQEISYKLVQTPTGVKKVKVIKKFITKAPAIQTKPVENAQPEAPTLVDIKPTEEKPIEAKQEASPAPVEPKQDVVEETAPIAKKKSSRKKKALLGILLPLAILGAAAYPVYYCVTKYGNFTNLSFEDEIKDYVENVRTQHKPKGDLYIYFVALTNFSSSKEKDLHCLTNVRLSLNGSEPQVLQDVVWYENLTASKDFNIKIIIPSSKINSISNTVKVGFDVSRFVIDPSIGSDMQISFINDDKVMVVSFTPVEGYDPKGTKLYNESGFEVPQSSGEKTYYELKEVTSGRMNININLESMVLLPNCAGALTFKNS